MALFSKVFGANKQSAAVYIKTIATLLAEVFLLCNLLIFSSLLSA